MSKISGIYQIQSRKKPERIYIGSSVNIYSRWSGHLADLRKQKHDNPKLQSHYNKYGKNDLVFSILVCCERHELLEAEQFYLDSKKTYFNIAPKAGNNLGYKMTPEQKEHIRLSKVGRKHDEERRKNQSILSMGEKNGFYGKKHTEEHKQKMREFMLAHPISREVRERQRESLLKYYERRRMEKELETQKN